MHVANSNKRKSVRVKVMYMVSI